MSGLGAASADAVYGSIAGFGLVFLSGLLLGWQQELCLLGGMFLLYLGWRMFNSVPTEQSTDLRSAGLVGDYASSCFLTLTNPVTILAFIGIFTGLGLAGRNRISLSSAGWWQECSWARCCGGGYWR